MGFGDNSFFATGPVFHHSNLPNSLLWGLEWILHRLGNAVPTYILLLLACYSWVCLVLGGRGYLPLLMGSSPLPFLL